MMNRGMAAFARGLAVLVLVSAALIGAPAALAPSEARAVIGRPLTPVSYAGVARRSSRRTARRTSARYAAASAPVPYATALPPDCALTGDVYACGAGPAYQPYYHGPEVVYVQVPS